MCVGSPCVAHSRTEPCGYGSLIEAARQLLLRSPRLIDSLRCGLSLPEPQTQETAGRFFFAQLRERPRPGLHEPMRTLKLNLGDGESYRSARVIRTLFCSPRAFIVL